MPSRCVTEHWAVRTGALDPDGILAQPPPGAFTLLHGDGRFVVLAEEPLAHLGAADLADLHWERTGEAPPIRPDLLGFVTYEHGYGLDSTLPAPPFVQDPLPDLRFTVHRRLSVFDRTTGLLHEAERNLPAELEPAPHDLGHGAFAARKEADTDTAAGYAAKVARIREAIAAGSVYQVNLTRQEAWTVQGSLAALARRLHGLNPAPFSALVADPAFTLLSSSPECFLRWDQGRILTRPIKGTAPRHADPRQDETQAR